MAPTHDTDHNFQIWNFESKTLEHSFRGHIAPLNGLTFNADGQWLLSSGDDANVRLWHLATSDLVEYRFTESKEAVNNASFSKHENLIFAGGDDDTIRVWGILNHELLDAIEAKQSGITALAISNNGQWLTGGKDGSIHLWAITSEAYSN